jgi:hypothetical protein
MKILCVGIVALSISNSLFADNIIRLTAPVTYTKPFSTPPKEPIRFSLINGAIPNAEDGAAYQFDFNSRVSTDGNLGINSLSWSMNGSAPVGLRFTPGGVLAGTPTGGFTGSLQVTASSEDLSVSSTFPFHVAYDVGDKPSYSNVVSLFRFNGNTNKEGAFAPAMSPYGVIGFSQNSPVEGQLSSSMSGANGLLNPDSYALGTSDFSIGAWFNTIATSGMQIISQNRDTQNTGQYQLGLNAGRILYYEYPNGIGMEGIGASGVSANEWHHVALVRSGYKVSIYLDGVLMDEKTPGTKSNLRSDNGLSIGYDQRDNRDFFKGNLKDVFQLNKVLTPREVMWLYKSREGFPSP